VFDEDELAELAASIREIGVLQPVVVRPITHDEREGSERQAAESHHRSQP
jgi:ParB family chromosome partitioning protein